MMEMRKLLYSYPFPHFTPAAAAGRDGILKLTVGVSSCSRFHPLSPVVVIVLVVESILEELHFIPFNLTAHYQICNGKWNNFIS